MVTAQSITSLKEEVRDFWDCGPCGTRYLNQADRFESHSRARYSLEPYIEEFAQFDSARGLRTLEVGVGMGSDYLQWLRAGAIATGVDLSPISLGQARHRCMLAGQTPDLRVADAENLPFADATFDLLYSYGVMHHSPDTGKCIQEAMRVLKPGGSLKIMLYHHRSLTGAMLWLRYGLLRGRSLRSTVYERLESPGTKTYTMNEVRAMLNNFEDVHIRQVFSPGDLLLHRPSPRFQSWFYRAIWKFYPRFLVRSVGKRWGLFLLIHARKPSPEPASK
ncbi:MAG TPA: class I SAM-dependent methyltransferase [Terriglobales bacterium]|nr:class I SAM-dependent methyltransferase [Terriglobales bacterium]